MLVLAVALLLQAAVPQDTSDAFDSPATRALVERTVRAGSSVPTGLEDYRAEIRSGIFLSLRPDSADAGELPATVDEFAGHVRWSREGGMTQTLRGHRMRLLVPAPYTVGSTLEDPWVIPHLYGATIDVFDLSSNPGGPRGRRVTRALQPFSEAGLPFYRFSAGDTVRIGGGGGAPIVLVAIDVRPRRAPPPGDHRRLVAGRFYLDVERAAVARARFGFTERGRLGLTRTGIFFELENGLVEGRFWLPYRQRREVQVASPLAGAAAAARLVTRFSGYELNTGWTPEAGGSARLERRFAPGDTVFAGWPSLGSGGAEGSMGDFADVAREAVLPGSTQGTRLAMRYESADQLFRFNRVEGAFLGVGAILEPRDPDARWQLFGTGGWAFAEGTARGELQARLRAPRRGGWGASAGAYRRLRDLQPFRPAWESRWIHTLSAALGGYDLRDYLDAAGVEAGIAARRGPWTLGGGVRIERQDSVVRNTGRFLLGEARDFPTLAPVEPGVHAALEGELRFGRGPGAMSLGNSTLAAVRGEVGAGDFRIARLTGLLSARRDLGPATLATRLDAGHVFGGGAAVPPQLLFRFGGTEGLRGYPHNAFAGSSALLGRGRLLVHLPPRRNQPLARSGIFIIPPLRPALVLSGDAGWTAAAGAPGTPLLRGKATETDGVRTSLGIGISVFDDALSAEWVRPDDGRTGRWYVGLVRWF